MNVRITLKKLEIPFTKRWNLGFCELKLISSISVIWWVIVLYP